MYIGSKNAGLYALSTTTGSPNGALLWSYATNGGIVSSPAVVNGIVYFGSNDGYVYALTQSESITITSSPTGSGYVTVDGNAISTPDIFSWAVGSTHTIAANSPVSGGAGTQYVYLSWNDSGAQSHIYT